MSALHRGVLAAIALWALAATSSEPQALWLDPAGRLRSDAREAIALLQESAADGLDPRDYPVPATDSADFDRALTVAAIYAHLKTLQLGSVVAHTWLDAFVLPEGLAQRLMVARQPGPAVGLIVLDREPNSLVAEALFAAATEAGATS